MSSAPCESRVGPSLDHVWPWSPSLGLVLTLVFLLELELVSTLWTSLVASYLTLTGILRPVLFRPVERPCYPTPLKAPYSLGIIWHPLPLDIYLVVPPLSFFLQKENVFLWCPHLISFPAFAALQAPYFSFSLFSPSSHLLLDCFPLPVHSWQYESCSDFSLVLSSKCLGTNSSDTWQAPGKLSGWHSPPSYFAV